MHRIRQILIYGVLFPAIGFVVIMFGSLWLEPISWIAGFDYELWDDLKFITQQSRVIIYIASCIVGWFVLNLFPNSYPVYVVISDEIREMNQYKRKINE